MTLLVAFAIIAGALGTFGICLLLADAEAGDGEVKVAGAVFLGVGIVLACVVFVLASVAWPSTSGRAIVCPPMASGETRTVTVGDPCGINSRDGGR